MNGRQKQNTEFVVKHTVWSIVQLSLVAVIVDYRFNHHSHQYSCDPNDSYDTRVR